LTSDAAVFSRKPVPATGRAAAAVDIEIGTNYRGITKFLDFEMEKHDLKKKKKKKE
jgi:hypothetical protein